MSRTEFSFLIHPSELEEVETKFDLNAESNERSALSDRFGLQGIDIFKLSIIVKYHKNKNAVQVNGKLYAQIIQNCVVSLVPIENTIDEMFEVTFYNKNQLVSKNLFDEAEFESYENDTIDLGELGAQEFALAINPYPRAEGIADETIGPYLPTKDNTKTNPFTALAAIKQKK